LSTLHRQAQLHCRELVFPENVSKTSARKFFGQFFSNNFSGQFFPNNFLDNFLIFKLRSTTEQMPALVKMYNRRIEKNM
jgi:hypothetical protein